MATRRLQIASSFANNLFRSPVEFVQAGLSLQRAAGGRFLAGLGAGWSEDEMTRIGMEFPSGPMRARRYREAMQICRELFDSGCCRHAGEHYDIDVPRVGPECAVAPPLVCSVGGPWVAQHVAPLADRVEVMPVGRAASSGRLASDAIASIDRARVVDLIAVVRDACPDTPLGLHVVMAAGSGPADEALRESISTGFFAGFFGDPRQVAEHIYGLAELGVERLTVTDLIEQDGHRALAGALFAR